MKRCNHEGSLNNLTANSSQSSNLVNDIRHLLEQSRQRLQQTVFFIFYYKVATMVQSYWQVGRLIVEDEQQGKSRATYGKRVLQQLASTLTTEFGKGFDLTNLRNMRRFYLAFPIRETVSLELSWSHYNHLARIENEQARNWYKAEAVEQSWSVRALERQLGVLYYERLLSSKDGKDVKAEATEKTLPLAIGKENYLRDPYILEFLNLPTQNVLETDIEHGIIDNLQKFILELGKGFAFVERQQRISTEDQDFYIDLVFYNFKLKCFLLIDLKLVSLIIKMLVKWTLMYACMINLKSSKMTTPP
ncbi:MAG: putative nuclease of restriction endonuclease-like (RecB) superfamily [Psychroserpens sp.]|jgi:predicted nuclease of restriction endonuclease-like (RecB) superfamily